MSVSQGQSRLRRIARALSRGTAVHAADRTFLVEALKSIADGNDANIVLEVVARRGERKGITARKKRVNKQFAMAWIAAAKATIQEGGLGLTLEKAIAVIGENGGNNFHLTEETLRKYWNNSSELRAVEFLYKED